MAAPTLTFLGAAGTVTGSKFLLESDGFRVLVDCGLFQGLKELRLQNRAPFPVPPESIDAVILTHAHLDHIGYLPLLVKNGFEGKAYCTIPTRELASIMLLDAARIQEEEANLANEMGYSRHDPARPLYNVEDADRALGHLIPVDTGKWHALGGNLRFRFTPSGHILGSAFVEVSSGSLHVAFSGDLGRQKPLLLHPPGVVERADYLVLESTYGDRVHDAEPSIRQLERIVNETNDRGGSLIIPSFAVGRTQDLLYLFHQLRQQNRIPALPVYVDSPMAIDVTRIFCAHFGWHRLKERGVKNLCEVGLLVKTQAESETLLRSRKRKIVIAGAGMVTGGRVLSHLEKALPDDRNTVLLVGYQAPGTRGRQLRDGAPEIKMHGQYVRVLARIEEISTLSAHADQKETLQWLRGFRKAPRRTFLVHGEPQAADALRVRIGDALGWECHIPKALEKATL